MRPTLPDGWQWVPLSLLVSKIEAGKSFKCDERPPSDDEPGIVKVSAVTWGTYDEQESKTITDAERVNDAYLIRPGDFLFSRANTLQLVGACVLVSATRKRLLLSDKILRFVMPDALKPWLLWFLRSAEGRRQIESLSTGNQESMRNIGQERIGRIEVPLPAEGTMQRIVSRIEELFSEIDEGERALERVGRLVERYRQSVLKAAVTGELTREWREARQQDGSAAADGLPPRWTQATLGSLSTKVTSGSRDWKSFYGRGDGVFIMAQNVRPGRLDFTEVQVIDPPLGSKDAERSQVAEGDLLVTIVGANTGDVCRVDRPLPKHFVCQSVALIRLADPRIAPFVELFLMADEGGQAQFAETIYGAGRPHLSFDQIKSVSVPLPPSEEQVAILDAVGKAESELKATLAAVAASRNQATALRQSILKAAFSGQLVPQGPRDEPASALLARLAAQPADAPATPRRRGRPAGRRLSQPNPGVAD
ncbi:MAG: restriction endonuclease subunit S [Burkholderiales bacterium]|nr:restriction endonuclease subunit S [Burkholderiales bacterium]